MRNKKRTNYKDKVLKYVGGEAHSSNRQIWKRIFYLPSEPVWYNTIIILNYITIIGHLSLSVNGECISENIDHLHIQTVFNVMDMIYLVDIILVTLSLYVPNLNLPEINIAMRPMFIIVTELISIIPLQLIVPWLNNIVRLYNPENGNIYCILGLNSILRIIRIIYFNYKHNSLITSKVSTKVFQTLSYLIFIVMIFYSSYCNIYCEVYGCEKVFCNRANLTSIVEKTIASGFAGMHENIAWEIIAVICQMLVYYCILVVTMAHVTIGFIINYRHQLIYLNRSNIAVANLRRLNLPKRLMTKINDFFNIVWTKLRGYITDQAYWRFLHVSMRNELMLDVSWPALQHSCLFRSMDLNYLRYLSNFITFEFMLPGQFLFNKNDWKNKMIYIASGTIQIISNEDGESCLISLCAGTCIGESSLVINYRAQNHVICKTFCEFHVLARKDFIKSYLKYPEHYKEAKEIIYQRYQNTLILDKISRVAKSKLNSETRTVDNYTLLWVKNTLHKLMAVDEESTRRHEFQNIYFLSEINQNDFNKLSFTARYLDMLVVGERIEIDTDAVFVQINFPCILQPNSAIGILWEMIIIVLTLFLSFTIPYMAFIRKRITYWYYPLVSVITHLYWLDIYVQLSTAIRSKHSVSTKIKTIAKIKMQTIALWIDILSCIPCEMLTSIITIENSPQVQARLHFNRLLKLWRVEKVFRIWESSFNANLVLVRYIKFSWINLYTTFFFYCLFYNVHKTETMQMIFASVQMVTGSNMRDRDYFPAANVTCLGDLCTTFITIVMYASIMSAYILLYLKRVEVQYAYTEMINIIIKKHLGRRFKARIRNVLYTEWDDNECTAMKDPEDVISAIPTYIAEEVMCHLAEEALRSIEFFSYLSEDALYDVCAKLKLITWPSHEPVLVTGQIPNELYIIIQGTYHILNSKGDIVKTSSKIGCYNLLGTLLNGPCVETVVTASNCKCLILSRPNLNSVLYKYIGECRDVLATISRSDDIQRRLLHVTQKNQSDTVIVEIPKKHNFFRFNLNLQASTFAQYDYHIPFDRLYPFAFIRHFLMRSTINCEGSFMIWWEIIRAILGFWSCLLYFIIPLYMSSYKIILHCLDGAGIVDIYLRLHVCYYNEDGLMITHPLKTATNYLKSAFIIDFIAVLPVSRMIKTYSAENIYLYFILNLNKLLPLYRCIGLISTVYQNTLTPLNKAYGLCVIPIVLILSNVCGSFLISRSCSYNMNDMYIFGDKTEDYGDVFCAADSLLATAFFHKPLSGLRVQLYAIYIGVSLLTTCGMQGFEVSKNDDRVIIMFMSFLGLYLTVVFAGKVITLYFFRHKLLLRHQEAMRSLKKFLYTTKVNPQLHTAVVYYTELKWSMEKGRRVHNIIKPLSVQMQADILYEIYGKKLYKTSVFTTKSNAFYRNLLPLTRHEFICKGGYIITINDVSRLTFILCEGVVEVLAPDGIVLTTLCAGSMFGNLEDVQRLRMRNSVVATCHAEVLTILSKDFHKLLRYEPLMKNEYKALRLKHVNYIPSEVTEVHAFHEPVAAVKKSKWRYVFDPNSRGMQIWCIVSLVFSCYLCIMIDLYQLGSGEHSIYIRLVQYTCDFLYIAQFIIKFRTAYEDEHGTLVTDLRTISKRICKNKYRLTIGIISLIPADILLQQIVAIPAENRMWLIAALRLNRLLRLTYVFEYFTTTSEKLNVNVYVMRFGFIALWISLVFFGMAALTTIVSCPFDLNIKPHVPRCRDIINLTSAKKFRLFLRHIYLAANFLNFSAQNQNFPDGVLHIIFFIAMMLTAETLFFVCVSQVYSVISEYSVKRQHFISNTERIISFMNNEEVSLSLVERIVAYIHLLWLEQRGDVFPSLLKEAPRYLKDAILNDAFRTLLIKHPIFARCHTDCLRQIIHKSKAITFFVGDYIQFKGVIDNCMYFIFNGEVLALNDETADDDDVVNILKRGDAFGIRQGLHYKVPHEYSYKASKRSILLVLDFNQWDYLLRFFPASKEQIYNSLNAQEL